LVIEAVQLGRRMRQPTSVSEIPPQEDGEAIIGRWPGDARGLQGRFGRVADQNVIVLITGEERHGQGNW